MAPYILSSIMKTKHCIMSLFDHCSVAVRHARICMSSVAVCAWLVIFDELCRCVHGCVWAEFNLLYEVASSLSIWAQHEPFRRAHGSKTMSSQSYINHKHFSPLFMSFIVWHELGVHMALIRCCSFLNKPCTWRYYKMSSQSIMSLLHCRLWASRAHGLASLSDCRYNCQLVSLLYVITYWV